MWTLRMYMSGKSPGERARAPPPVLLPGESHGQRSLVGYSPWGRTETDRIEQLTSTFKSFVLWIFFFFFFYLFIFFLNFKILNSYMRSQT